MAQPGYGGRVEGLHAVAAAASAGRVEKLWVESRRRRRGDVESVVQAVSTAEVSFVDDVRPLAETEAPQGVVARCTPLASVPLVSLAEGRAAVMILDHLVDPHNVGAVARSAAAAGITGLVVSDRRAAPLSATAFKAAAGALERLPVAIVGSIADALRSLAGLGLWTIGLDAGGESSLFGLDLLTEPVALVVGAEGSGLSSLVRARCEVVAAIPMAGPGMSLNASVASALAAFEVMRVRGAERPPGRDQPSA